MSTDCQPGHSCLEVPADIETFSRVEGQATQWTALPWNSLGRSAYHRISQATRIVEKTFSWEISLHNMESLSAMLQIDSTAQGMDRPPSRLTSRLLSSLPARVPKVQWRGMDMGWSIILKLFPRKCPLFISSDGTKKNEVQFLSWSIGITPFFTISAKNYVLVVIKNNSKSLNAVLGRVPTSTNFVYICSRTYTYF